MYNVLPGHIKIKINPNIVCFRQRKIREHEFPGYGSIEKTYL